jgi:hypothetical protein
MRYKVLENFKIKRSKGEMELQSGQLVTLPHDKAIELISEGKIAPVEKVAYKLYSEILQSYFWFVEDDEDMNRLRGQGIKEAIYTKQEIEKIKVAEKDTLKAIHPVKEVFEKSKIVEFWNKSDES